MKNVLLHIRKADHQLRMALSGLTKQGHPLIPKVGHAVATLREVKYALEAEALSKAETLQEGQPGGKAGDETGPEERSPSTLSEPQAWFQLGCQLCGRYFWALLKTGDRQPIFCSSCSKPPSARFAPARS